MALTERNIQCALYWRHRSSARIMVPNYTPYQWQECDMLIVTSAGYSIEYEIKLSVSDFRADFGKYKHRQLRDPASAPWTPTRFFFAVPEGLVSADDVPAYAGLVYASLLPHRPTGTPEIEVVRSAPRLRNEKMSDEMETNMRLALTYRFWNERFRFDDYRRDVHQMRVATAPAPACEGVG